ncbi:hypothetical protein E2562_017036 [Oryza meyeriana var. granulata]|uniref:Uncharacterized protein n=1 Tax=Oryza meyeriana var. granulata TaxID=110450 RepID=A0A6G1E9I6_9ORYZ|nr:hypothetical protein E2562_017036 [Oryza meyeriana var. granulata]
MWIPNLPWEHRENKTAVLAHICMEPNIEGSARTKIKATKSRRREERIDESSYGTYLQEEQKLEGRGGGVLSQTDQHGVNFELEPAEWSAALPDRPPRRQARAQRHQINHLTR